MTHFSLTDRIAFITGGAGLLGIEHGKAVWEAGGVPILADLREDSVRAAAVEVGKNCGWIVCDVTDKASVETAFAEVLRRHGKVDILVNNAARNPKVENLNQAGSDSNSDALTVFPQFRDLSLRDWELDIAVGLTGTMFCCQVFGTWMAEHGGGSIVNIGSEYAIIAPDQTIYRIDGLPENQQPSKPLTYTVVKHAVVGLTKHLAIYWAKQGVRVNCLCPGGVEQNQDPAFKEKLTRLIPMGHMAPPDHVRGALVFLCSDASAFMTGEIVAVNGGRTVW